MSNAELHDQAISDLAAKDQMHHMIAHCGNREYPLARRWLKRKYNFSKADADEFLDIVIAEYPDSPLALTVAKYGKTYRSF